MVTNGDSGNIGANSDNDDPLETMMIHWSYNGGNCDNYDNGSNGDIGTNGFIGTSSVISTNRSIDWPEVLERDSLPLLMPGRSIILVYFSNL